MNPPNNTRHVDVLDQQDSLRAPFTGSMILHAAVFLTIIGSTWVVGKRDPWGDPNALGGASVGITPVRSIPLPGRTGPVNKVAQDTESEVPSPPKPEVKKMVQAESDAIALKSKKAPKAARAEARPTPKVPERSYSPNQVYSRAGQAATSPLYGTAPGSGGVGVGTGAPFGNRFGGYSRIIQDRVASKWRTDQVDSRLTTAPPVVVTFEILRDGQVRNVRVQQSSGNYALDASAQRAVTEAAPFEPLPAAYDGSSAVIEFWFQLKR